MKNNCFNYAAALTMFSLVFLLAFSQNITAQEHDAASEKVSWMNVQGSGYDLSFPSSWDFDQEGTMGTEFIAFAQLDNLQDKFRENLNLVVQDISSYDLTLKDYTDLSREQILNMLEDARIVDSRYGKNSSGEYAELEYSGSMIDNDLYFYQRYFIKEGKAYVLTFTVAQAMKEEYEEIKDELLSRFTILDTEE